MLSDARNVAWARREQGADSEEANPEPQRTASQGEHHTFREQLAYDAAPARAYG
jgi:hypothetical protein